MPQLDASGQDPGGRRFRIENGDSLGEKEEVSTALNCCGYDLEFWYYSGLGTDERIACAGTGVGALWFYVLQGDTADYLDA